VAAEGNFGRVMSAEPVERMVMPLGRDTVRGWWVMTVVGVGQAVAVRKWPVLPVSAMAVERSEEGRVGVPVIDKQEVDSKTGLISTFKLLSIGSPRRQRGVAGRSFALHVLDDWTSPETVGKGGCLAMSGVRLDHVALVCV
jgi:hypothetical protein